MEGYPQPGPRAILNANKGVSNVIEQKVINTDLRRVTKDIFNVLVHHYGPYSGFAALDDAQPLNETNFTKDGIGIVRAIEYASPQEEWVRKTLEYIGTKMESSVGDGTTSAMMFTCAMLQHMSEHIDELRPLSYHAFRTEFNEFVRKVKEQIERNYVFKPFKSDGTLDQTAIYNIVYNQVYTSSHGDEALSESLAELYQKTPKELWERMTYERRRYESDKNFEVISSDGQYQMNCDVMNTAMLNKDICSKFDKDNCSVIIINDSLRIDHPEWPRIEKMIEDATAIRPVVIVCHRISDDQTYERVSALDGKCAEKGNPFALFSARPEHPQINDFAALQLIAGIDTKQLSRGGAVIVDGCHVKYESKKLSISGLYEDPEGYTGLERSLVTDGKHGVFTDHLDAWKKQAEMYAKQAMDRESRSWTNYYNRMYVKLRYTKTNTVVIGGKSYDNVAFVDVLDDALRAASRALVNGATFGNNRALYLVVDEIVNGRKKKNSYLSLLFSKTEIWFARRIKETLEDIAKVVLKRANPHNKLSWFFKNDFVDWWFSHAVDLLHYDPDPENKRLFKPWRNQLISSPKVVNNARDLPDLFSNDGFICQPANSDIIMLERFGEIALKFILTERVIIHGGAYVDKKRK